MVYGLIGTATPAPGMISDVMTAVETGMTSMVSDLGDAVAGIVPIVIPIFGLIIAIGVIKKVVRRFSS